MTDTSTELQRLREQVDALEGERRRLLSLVEILPDVTGATHYPDIVQVITRRLGHLFGLDRCSVFLAARAGGPDVHLVASYEDPAIRNHLVDLVFDRLRLGGDRLTARRNVHRHYDLGNDFYRLWLDEQLVYTCAYFPAEDASLEVAQRAKMDHGCRKADIHPGDVVFEAGCGWGALALHAARHYGARVRAWNLSTEQVAYARERARAEGLDDRVEFVEDDYRRIDGTCDVFPSRSACSSTSARGTTGIWAAWSTAC